MNDAETWWKSSTYKLKCQILRANMVADSGGARNQNVMKKKRIETERNRNWLVFEKAEVILY